jgi:hypothetical protein
LKKKRKRRKIRMRTDKEGRIYTLDEDIERIWHLHGWSVIKESVKGNKWEITAIREDEET